MTLDEAKELINNNVPRHVDFERDASEAERYYLAKNDILKHKERSDAEEANPLHTADNKIPSSLYGLQIDQKAAYAFTKPPTFDVDDDHANDVIRQTLGDSFTKKCKSLCVQASNASVAWLHYWKNDADQFRYAVVDSREIVPIWTKSLEKELQAAIRKYTEVEGDTTYIVYEVWTDTEVQAFRKALKDDRELEAYPMYSITDLDTNDTELTDTYKHGFTEVPFIFFNNRDTQTNDLSRVKALIDAYDTVLSGFLNDLEDIQEVIFVLTNYGGEGEGGLEILQKMKEKKVIQIESESAEDRSGVSTLAIEIPVEARKEMLKTLRKEIFEQGQAVDPDPDHFGNQSGVALKYLYSLLDLKVGLMRTEFELSFNRLIRAILNFYHLDTTAHISQTWTYTTVANDVELADIAQKSKGIISDETIVRHHPWVTDAERELERLEEQEKAEGPDWDKVPVGEDDDE